MKPALKADFLNKNCHCRTLDAVQLASTLVHQPQNDATGIYFSESPHFLSEKDLNSISQFVSLHEILVKSPAYIDHALRNNRAFSELFGYENNFQDLISAVREHGVFNSYDFHITADGPRLIEINSNAAGAVLSFLAQQQAIDCCIEFGSYRPAGEFLFSEQKIVDMFRSEYARVNAHEPLRTIAIVDENPTRQYFYAEFIALQSILQKHDIEVVIGDTSALKIQQNKVFLDDKLIQLIYNRSTDFYFKNEPSANLKEIFLRHLAAMSPNPIVHALYASKQNLAQFYSGELVKISGMNDEQLMLMQTFVPETQFVTPANAAKLWDSRRDWFFKPSDGYAGKGAYKGEKITRKVFDEIQKGHYLAQRFVAPDERKITPEITMKYDIRAYTYAGKILGLVARYYRGQTTNFRTERGGLASVFIAA